jgi:hypothetical protein
MGILEKFLNPIYLDEKYISLIQEDIKAKVGPKFVVLNNLFLPHILEQMSQEYLNTVFDPNADGIDADKNKLPFDGAATMCDSDTLFGELLYSKE